MILNWMNHDEKKKEKRKKRMSDAYKNNDIFSNFRWKKN